ncbi:MAG TPA: PCRF domain-containing protein, partial [Spirochaetia bacterium]|nr:PCRF domain-containing protein [Spirochaetia bacterium]
MDQIERQTAQADFWQDKEKAGEAMARLKALKRRYEPWSKLRTDYDDLMEIWRLALEEKDESLEPELRSTWEGLEKKYDELKLLELLGEETDA